MDDKPPLKGAWSGSRDLFYILESKIIPLQRRKLQSSNFVHK